MASTSPNPFVDVRWLWKNGELVDFASATVHAMTHALHYGSGVFEGIRCYKTKQGSAVFRLPEHVRRLQVSARVYRMEIPYDADGISEAMNAADDCFGETRLGRIVEEHAHLPSDQLRERILREIAAFVGDAPQHDDMTMILLRIEQVAAAVQEPGPVVEMAPL